MVQKILFSPIGTTDPIATEHDGAMLHILRHLKPDIVYLYLSSEMLNYHNKDNRYVKTIELLSEKINHKFTIVPIERKDLIDVQFFDTFYEDYSNCLTDIHKEYPDAEIIVNVSSGSPGMKACLHSLASFLEFPITPIQVASPAKSSNSTGSHKEDRVNYEIELNWEFNKDNEENAEPRYYISKSQNLALNIKKKMIFNLIDKKDYEAAHLLAETDDNNMILKQFKELLWGASSRIQLDYTRANSQFKRYGYDILPYVQADKAKIAEYILWLKIKVEKKEYLDFLRGITPVLLHLFESSLKKCCGVDIDDYTRQEKNSPHWDEQKLRDTEVLDSLNNAYLSKRGSQFKVDSFVQSDHLCYLMKNSIHYPELINDTEELRKIERDIRNIAAHQIVSCTDEWIYRKINKEPVDIMKMLSDYCNKYTEFSMGKKMMNSYEEMNDILKKSWDS